MLSLDLAVKQSNESTSRITVKRTIPILTNMSPKRRLKFPEKLARHHL